MFDRDGYNRAINGYNAVESQDSTGEWLWIATLVVYVMHIRIEITHIFDGGGVGVTSFERRFYGKAAFGVT